MAGLQLVSYFTLGGITIVKRFYGLTEQDIER